MTALPFPGRLPAVDAARCLNLRHNQAGCTRCVTACPTDAIQLVAGQPVLDDGACVVCGLCLHSCPTEVFDQTSAPEAILIQVGEQLSPQPLAVVCPLHSAPESSAAPVAAIVQHRRCLAALSPADLLELSQLGTRPLWLDDSECAECPIGQAQATLRHSVRVTHTLLHAYGQSSTIRLFSEHVATLVQPPQHRPLIDGGQPKLSRRSLLTQLHTRVVETMISSPHPELETPAVQPEPGQRRIPQRVPAARLRLLELLATFTAKSEQSVPTGDVPFAAVQVRESRCSGCALCASFCPTGALNFITQDAAFLLRFQPAVCLDCGICVQACPEDAVQLGETLNADELTAQTPYSLVEGLLAPCIDCGLPTAFTVGAEQRPKCYSCRHGAGRVQSLHDEAGLMADLLKRIPPVDQLPKTPDV